MGELANRRQALVDEREALEAELRAILQSFVNMDDPSKGDRFVDTRIGRDGSQMVGSPKIDAIKERLVEIQKQLKAMPSIITKRVARAVNVLGKDLSEYASP
jgi:hypothetical protein